MWMPKAIFLLALLISTLLSTAHAQPVVTLNGSWFNPPNSDSLILPIDQPPNFIFVSDNGQIIGPTPTNGGDTYFLSFFTYEDPSNVIQVELPGDSLPPIIGELPDTGLPGDDTTVFLFNNSATPPQSMGVSPMNAPMLPPFALPIIEAIDDELEKLQLMGCDIFRFSYNSNAEPYYEVTEQPELDGSVTEIINFFDGIMVLEYQVFVHCADRSNFVIFVYATHNVETREFEVTAYSVPGSLSGGGNRAAFKNVEDLPIAALPPGAATIGYQGAGTYAYFGEPAMGGSGFSAIPTIVWLNPDRSVGDWLQIDGHPGGFASDLAICASTQSRSHWVAWTGVDGNAKLARVTRPATVRVFDLGPTTGFTVMDCDNWGNVLAAWADPDGSVINLRSYAQTGNQGSSTSFSISGPSFVPMSISLNNNGQAALAFSDNTGTHIQRVFLENAVNIDMSFAGSWNSPAFDGEGFIWDVAEINGVPTLVLYYFTYLPDGSGAQSWVVGSAPLINGVATVPMAITSGATFGSAFDSDDVSAESWGEIEVRVQGCRYATATMRSPVFGNHAYPATKFTASPTGLDGLCANDTATAKGSAKGNTKGGIVVDGSFTGSFFSPQRNFEGFIFDVTQISGQTTLVVYWFSYDIDGSGNQLWLVGAAPINGDSVTIPLVRTSDGQFGSDFDPNNVTASSFVTVTITWSDCNNATVMYQVDGGESGSFNIQRLAALPTGAGGACGP